MYAGQEFAKVGLQNCHINSSLPVGTVLQIPFLVWDNGHPALSARVNRTLVITAPCAIGKLPLGPYRNIACGHSKPVDH